MLISTLYRILDPILYELLDPTIVRTPTQVKVHGKEIQSFTYTKQFDQRYINYLLEILLAVVRFGGQGFVKTAISSPIRRSYHPGLISRVDASEYSKIFTQAIHSEPSVKGHIFESEGSYFDVLKEILLRLV